MEFVFISHSNNDYDKPYVSALCAELGKRHICYWVDGMLGGGTWSGQVSDKLPAASAYIFVASRNSFHSPRVIEEITTIRHGKHFGKILIPYVIDDYFLSDADDKGTIGVFVNPNMYQAVFADRFPSAAEAVDYLIKLLPQSISRLENDPNDFKLNADYTELRGYTGDDIQVVVPSGVVTIAKRAFMGRKKLQKVIIPPSVKTIGANAFFGCSELAAVEGMENVDEVDSSAFAMSGVKPSAENEYMINGVVFGAAENDGALVLPVGARAVAAGAFTCKKNLEIIFPENLEAIGENAFKDCYNVRRLVFPRTLKHIGKNAFSGCLDLKEAVFTGPLPPNAALIFDKVTITEESDE